MSVLLLLFRAAFSGPFVIRVMRFFSVLLEGVLRIKICGLTRAQDVQAACLAGADALGFVFYPRSSRHLEIEQARVLLAAVPPFVGSVALFMNASASEVANTISQLRPLGLDLLQFHGEETAGFCESFDMPYIKAIAMGGAQQDTGKYVAEYMQAHPRARGFLLDSHALGSAGGSGEVFDWQRVPRDCAAPLILAGGLSVDNVAEAVHTAAPYGVDVSSGVEQSPGIKDPYAIQQFIQHARQAAL